MSKHPPSERHVPPPIDHVPVRDVYVEGSPFQPFDRPPLVQRTVPITQDIQNYGPGPGRRDLIAGVTVAALALPSAMAYAELAGIPPQYGLYALLLPTLAYVLLGSSKQLVIGPEGSISALVGAAILPLVAAGSPEAAELAALMALIVAGCFAIAWVLRLGWIADYLSRPVLVGYIHGVAIVLIVGQLGKLFGLSIEASDPIPQLVEVFQELDERTTATVLVSVLSLVAVFGLKWKAPALPAALLVVIVATFVSWAMDLEGRGVQVLGDIPAGLPSFKVPTASESDLAHLVPAAVGIFALSFADGIMTARSFAGKNGQHVRASQELLAFSAASAAAGFSQGMPVGASGSRTAVADGMRVRTQVAGVVAASAIALVLLFFTAPVSYLPKAVLGAVIVVAAVGLVDTEAWRSIVRVHRTEAIIAVIAMVGVVAVGVLEAIVLAAVLTLVDVVRRSASPHDAVLGWVERLGRYADVALHPSARVTPGIVVYRLDDRLFYANARYVQGRIREAIHGAPNVTSWLVFDAESMTHVDSTGLEALETLVGELRRQHVSLVFARTRSVVQRRLDEAGITALVGAEHFYPTVRAAVQACQAEGASRSAGLDPSVPRQIKVQP